MSRFWPVAESAQADYEALRDAVLATGTLPDELASARFRRRGLAGLIAWPAAEPVFVAELRGSSRPAWSPDAVPASRPWLLPTGCWSRTPTSWQLSRSRDGRGGTPSTRSRP